MKRFILLALLVLALGLLLAACGQSEPPAPQPAATQVPCPECPACPTCPPPVTCPEPEACPEPVVATVPFEEAWANSPHNDIESVSFSYWNTADPAVIPASCAKCHSETGFLDFLGADGSEAGAINAENVPVGTTVTCIACHNDVTVGKTSVKFPSGMEIANLGGEATCMECHQGRQSKVQVDTAIANSGAEEDAVSDQLSFLNIHYYAAAATLYGAQAMGGYQYDGKAYDIKFEHVRGYDTCQTCHAPHSLEMNLAECQTCHSDVATAEDWRKVRMEGSEADYDGDGNVTEGIVEEVEGLQKILYSSIVDYSKEVAGTMVVYNPERHPYWFIDANENGQPDEGEERYASWTPRMLKAAYNYQVSKKDPGEYAHNGKYIIQLLYDSIENLNEAIANPVDMTAMHRIDPGHFAGSETAFRYWDSSGVVPANCVKCHQADGLPQFIAEGVNTSQAPSNSFLCTTCHTDFETYGVYEIAAVKFPSGAVVSMEGTGNNLCLSCHQGRSSTATVNAAVSGLEEDTVPERALRFSNIHYFAAGATLFGDEVQGAYQYAGLDYLGRYNHVPGFQTCTDCHGAHELALNTDKCFTCHAGVATVQDIRGPLSQADYDGDGDTTEGLDGEIMTIADKLYAAMQDYATTVVGTAIVYDSHAFPYFFEDTNGDGERNEGEPGYSAWTPRLLKAAYNYQYAQKDPGAFTHNGKYVIQFLYDTLSSLSQRVTVDMTGMVRPDTPAQ